MTATALACLALVQLLIAMSPGPAAVLTIRTAAVDGVKPALTLSVGLAVGVLLWAVAALLGLSLVFEIMPWLQTGLRVIGGLFLIWIALSLWRNAAAPLPETCTQVPRSTASILRLGVWTNLANPKALAYFAAVFTGALPADLTWVQALIVLAMIFVIETGWYAALSLLFSGTGPRRIYVRIKTGAERVFGVLLGLFGVRIALS
ncbi:LysE family transporter [Sulfitobacter mediterraneus]|uniref:LysE family translocator n=1 Tax=Sulfitobacter mediterraneus TaxID=83219 RepID=UPI00193393E8|nr:LysE family transporter [Sulfitobacter mediterraneus]MBM1309200.1 LysE family transporter [Sulfitobacter mediterraneus]MBM1313085.1 LysE family transporter [Sulfitobacter mediterraneus]MBM1321469.1 LysE family transporter [Sulfitobacter mediterraneus]MBM1325356.1 LysE family transporter [Sulfitobacter mediterraneus]MBM1396702.1 LysE family transporter [Sulfitobacter mediterraneus]